MNNKINNKIKFIIALLLASVLSCYANPPEETPTVQKKRISISVQETDMASVLRLISEQAQKNIVVGPDVAKTTLNIDIKDATLNEALDVILKPYGYGYHTVGNTYVVDVLDNLAKVATVEPLHTRVFKLKYIDAADVLDTVKGMLSERGSCEALFVAPKRGWEAGRGSGEDGEIRRSRAKQDEDERSSTKTLIVSDIPSTLTQIEAMLNQVDEAPQQVEISSHFIEMKTGALFDLGVDWQMNLKGSEYQTGGLLNDGTTSNSIAGTLVHAIDPRGFPGANSTQVSGTSPYNAGLTLGLLRTGSNLDIATWLHAVEENGDINVLSAPRVMTQNNQEASIIVGRKVPIISTRMQGDNGFTTELEYYERIGIQLNVVPQICDDNRISLVVHPSVSEQDGVAKASVSTGSGIPTTEFPIIQTREVETRLTLGEGETAVIGGLISDRQVDSELKVPLLGDIPFIKHLFRRDIKNSEKVELVILLSASIKDGNEFSANMEPITAQSEQKLIEKWTMADTPDSSESVSDPFVEEDSVEAEVPVEQVMDTVDTADAADTADTVDTVDTVNTVDTADTIDAADTVDTIDTAETVDTADSTDEETVSELTETQ